MYIHYKADLTMYIHSKADFIMHFHYRAEFWEFLPVYIFKISFSIYIQNFFLYIHCQAEPTM